MNAVLNVCSNISFNQSCPYLGNSTFCEQTLSLRTLLIKTLFHTSAASSVPANSHTVLCLWYQADLLTYSESSPCFSYNCNIFRTVLALGTDFLHSSWWYLIRWINKELWRLHICNFLWQAVEIATMTSLECQKMLKKTRLRTCSHSRTIAKIDDSARDSSDVTGGCIRLRGSVWRVGEWFQQWNHVLRWCRTILWLGQMKKRITEVIWCNTLTTVVFTLLYCTCHLPAASKKTWKCTYLYSTERPMQHKMYTKHTQ